MPYVYNPLLDAGLDQTGAGATTPGGSSTQVQFNNAGSFGGISTLTYDGSILTTSGRFINSYNAAGIASAPAKAFTGTWFTGGSATTTKPHLLIEPTGTTSTGWSTAGTGLGVNAASGFTGNLLDLQVNGSRQASINQTGLLTLASKVSGAFISSGGISFSATAGGVWLDISTRTIINGGIICRGGNIDLTDGGGINAVSIERDAANTLAQRNGTNAQTFRCYNTYTSATNYELGKLEWNTNVFRIGTEKGSGGGTARTVEVHTDSIARLALDTTGSVRVVTGLTVATLPGTPAVGMIARVTDATAPAMGAIVAGGGAAAALVWYNGTNWRVIGV